MTTNQQHYGIGDNYQINGDAYLNVMQRHPTLLGDVVNELGKRNIISEPEAIESFKEFKITEKIRCNNIVKYKEIIEEHRVYHGKLNAIYEEMDESGSSKKLTLLTNIRSLYLKAKGEYRKKCKNEVDEQSVVCENSDNIIEYVEKELITILHNSNNIRVDIETMRFGVLVVLVDAFMRCDILEAPKADT